MATANQSLMATMVNHSQLASPSLCLPHSTTRSHIHILHDGSQSELLTLSAK